MAGVDFHVEGRTPICATPSTETEAPAGSDFTLTMTESSSKIGHALCDSFTFASIEAGGSKPRSAVRADGLVRLVELVETDGHLVERLRRGHRVVRGFVTGQGGIEVAALELGLGLAVGLASFGALRVARLCRLWLAWPAAWRAPLWRAVQRKQSTAPIPKPPWCSREPR